MTTLIEDLDADENGALESAIARIAEIESAVDAANAAGQAPDEALIIEAINLQEAIYRFHVRHAEETEVVPG